MKVWFEQLAPRERMLVSIGAVFTVLVLIIMIVVRPITNRTAQGYDKIEDKQALLTELNQVAQRFGPRQNGGSGAVSSAGQSMVVIVDQTTRANGLAAHLRRNQPDGTESIRLRFENASFDTLIEWLTDLQTRHGIATIAANIDVAAEAGRINCNLTLSRAGG
jgi:general secretion pathway protein M